MPDKQQHHYFATNAMGWATAETREEAQTKLMQDTDPTWVRNCLKSGNLLTVFSCKVPLPADASYKIDWYVPQVDGVSDGQNHFVTYLTKTKHALMRDPSDALKLRIKELEADLEGAGGLDPDAS